MVSADASRTQIAPGIIFGWDIRPIRNPWFILRTNLPYTPGLSADVSPGNRVAFDPLEFNFIQFVWYPGADTL